MRVGLVCPYSLSEPGGVQTQVIGLARALRALGHDVHVVAPGVVPHTEGTSAGRARGFPVNGSRAPMAPQPTAGLRAVRALGGGRFDVIHVHEPLAPSIGVPVLLTRPAPLVATFHAAGDRTPYRWCGPALARLARRIDVRVTVSEAAHQLAARHLGGSYQRLFNGIDAARFRNTPVRPAPDAAAGPIVLFLGRHEPRKGLDVLLEACSFLPSDTTVWVGGDGPDTARLQHRHRHDRRIEWLGRLSETDKIRRLGAASVLCAPSLEGESFGVVLLEAMAARTPAVASDLPGYRALNAHGQAVLLVPPADPLALAAGLLQVLADTALAENLRRAADQFVERHSMDELARRYVDIYETVVAPPSLQRTNGNPAEAIRP